MTNELETTSVFISRNLTTSSPVKALLNADNIAYAAQSLIHFEPLPFEAPTTEWLFFYSKSGVKYFVEKVGYHIRDFKVAIFGTATARYFSNLTDRSANYVGDVDQDHVAQELVELIDDNHITFVVGKHSLRSVQKVLDTIKFNWKEVEVYDHHPIIDIQIPTSDIAILTSPMNVEAFKLNEAQTDLIIAIGKTTAAACKTILPNIDMVIANAPNEDGIATTLASYIENK